MRKILFQSLPVDQLGGKLLTGPVRADGQPLLDHAGQIKIEQQPVILFVVNILVFHADLRILWILYILRDNRCVRKADASIDTFCSYLPTTTSQPVFGPYPKNDSVREAVSPLR